MPNIPENQRSTEQSLGRAFEAIAPTLKPKVFQLYRAEQQRRLQLLFCLWLMLVPLCLWQLRKVWELLLEYFTWSALKIGLQYNLLPTMGIVTVLLLTASTLARWLQVRWFGLSRSDIKRFVKKAAK